MRPKPLIEQLLSLPPDPNLWVWVLPSDDGKITPECPSEIFDSGIELRGSDYIKFGNCFDVDYYIDDYAQGMEMIRDEGARELIQEFNQQLEGFEDD